MLLLDEPTSQVDLAGEAAIVESIEQLAQGRTVITVSHRAGALTTADRAVRVEARGVHEVSPAQDPGPVHASGGRAGTGTEPHEAGGTAPEAAAGDHGEERA